LAKVVEGVRSGLGHARGEQNQKEVSDQVCLEIHGAKKSFDFIETVAMGFEKDKSVIRICKFCLLKRAALAIFIS
jgi:hypothetical protein